jgi:hypothetical protein
MMYHTVEMSSGSLRCFPFFVHLKINYKCSNMVQFSVIYSHGVMYIYAYIFCGSFSHVSGENSLFSFVVVSDGGKVSSNFGSFYLRVSCTVSYKGVSCILAIR